jgi:23S rRNA pseudouridine2605 synthase
MMQRLQSIIQQAGLTSRRGAEEWIREGRVLVNGVVAHLGDKADPERDAIVVDGTPLTTTKRVPVYLALNKPKGYTTSLRDPHAEHVITELIPPQFGRVFPIGRLDRDTQGLLLLTNDGHLAYRLAHPSFHVPKVYEAWIAGVPGASHLKRLQHGIVLDDGPAYPESLTVVRRQADRTLVRLTLYEGRKREVRRIFAAVGHPVLELTRIQYADITLEGLAPGAVRPLKHREVEQLKHWGIPHERSVSRGQPRPQPQTPSSPPSRRRDGLSARRPRHSFRHPR